MVTNCSILTSKDSNAEHTGTIKLAHFTVKEYLTTAHANFNEHKANCLIAESCLGYLLQFNAPGSLDNRNIQNFQLARYAAQYWVQHARDAEQRDGQTEVMKQMIGDIFESETAFVTWIQLFDPQSPWEGTDFTRRAGVGTSCYFAAFLGLLQQVQTLIQKGADVNAQGGDYGNALQAASLKGHWEIVQFLIDNGADVNAQGGRYGNALQAASASYYPREETVKLLLEKGADVNAQGGKHGNALQAASDYENHNIVTLLINHGAELPAASSDV